MAGRSASCSAGTCDERRSDHDHGGRHGRPRLPGARRRRSAACAARRASCGSAHSAASKRAWCRRRGSTSSGSRSRACVAAALPRGSRAPFRIVARRAAGACRAAPPPPRGRARHGRVRRGTGRRRRVARAQAAGDARAERGGRHDEPRCWRRSRRGSSTSFPGTFPPSRARRGDRQPGARARSRRSTSPRERLRRAPRAAARVCLIVGGSQGARILNRTVPAALALLPEAERPEVWHQAGRLTVDEARAAYAAAGVERAHRRRSSTTCRAPTAGPISSSRAPVRSTLAELAIVGVGAILVPFATAIDDHQTRERTALRRGRRGSR